MDVVFTDAVVNLTSRFGNPRLFVIRKRPRQLLLLLLSPVSSFPEVQLLLTRVLQPKLLLALKLRSQLNLSQR